MSEATYEDRAAIEPTGWQRFVGFASTLIVISGLLNLTYGLIAVLNDEWVVIGNRADLYLDISTWGWVHVVLGVILLISGVAVLTGNVLARTVGVLAAAANIVTNFLWLPAYPIWSVVLITVDLLIIWALTVHGRDMEV